MKEVYKYYVRGLTKLLLLGSLCCFLSYRWTDKQTDRQTHREVQVVVTVDEWVHIPFLSASLFLAASSLCCRMMASLARSLCASSVCPALCLLRYEASAACLAISSLESSDIRGYAKLMCDGNHY